MTAELAFATSGTTGEPVRWVRSAEQIRTEAGLLVSLVGADIDGVVCYAPPIHLYGHLMGLAIPELLGVPGRYVSLTAPPDRAFTGLRRPMIAAVPAAMSILLRSLPALRRVDEIVLVHGSSVLPPTAERLLAAMQGRGRLLDLYGSTETGLIASRTAPDAPWTPAPDVVVAAPTPGVPGPLRLRSPRLARPDGQRVPAEMELEDVVRLHADGTFRWLGRRSRMVKVNGRRVYLDQVEARLRSAVPGIQVTCVPHPDPLRGEWFSVLVGAGEGQGVIDVEQACHGLPAAERPSAVTAA